MSTSASSVSSVSGATGVGVTRVMAVYGSAAQAAGLAPLICALRAHPGSQATTVSTGEQRHATGQAGPQEPWPLHSDHDLGLSDAGQDRNALTAGVFSRFGKLLESRAPDAVLVQGGTTTMSAVALTAFHRGIPVLHLEPEGAWQEPGSPFPQEADRTVLERVCSVHLVTSLQTRARLERQGVPAERILSAASF